MNQSSKSFRTPGRQAFTLVELLVSIVILTVILVVLATITSQTEVIWRGTTAKIEQFRSARNGFNTLVYRLGQAALDTYITYSDGSGANGTKVNTFYNTANFAPTTFVRESNLRFLSGASSTTMQNLPGDYAALPHPTQSIFFIAPLGYTTTTSYKPLTQALNVCGYYLEFGTDTSLPTFYTSLPGYVPRYRFRLMELLEPSEDNGIYTYTAPPPAGPDNSSGNTTVGSQNWNGWVTSAYSITPAPVHILAENIIALIILPQLGQDQTDSSHAPFSSYALAPYYGYDSTQLGAAGSPTSGNPTGGLNPNGGPDAGALNSHSQLPPMVQVTMVAIDEPSAIRLQTQLGATEPDFGLSALFQDASKYAEDLGQLRANLGQNTYTDATGVYNPAVTLPKNINYHVFTSTVSIKGARWSTLQTN